ncbi:hypothetical protein QJS66_04545 [Kocuria rhizophila]|nr:hypothetical protein QJS66_04545 [Kocuria rhizophila]
MALGEQERLDRKLRRAGRDAASLARHRRPRAADVDRRRTTSARTARAPHPPLRAGEPVARPRDARRRARSSRAGRARSDDDGSPTAKRAVMTAQPRAVPPPAATRHQPCSARSTCCGPERNLDRQAAS